MNKKLWMIAGASALIVVLLVIAIIFGVDWTTTVGICYRDEADQVNGGARQLLEQSLMAQGYEVIVTDAAGDQALQNKMIGHLQKQNCDILVIEPVLTTAEAELNQVISAAGIPCVLINRPLESGTTYPYVGIDAAALGSVQGQMMIDLPEHGDINGDGTVCYMLIQGPEGHLDTEQRTRGLETALEACPLQTQLLSVDNGDWGQESGQQICSRELALFGKDIEVIVCGNDAMAQGAAQAVTDGGWQVGQDVYLLGIGTNAALLEQIRTGAVTGTVGWDEAAFAKKVTEVVAAYVAGQTPESQMIECNPITARNLDS